MLFIILLFNNNCYVLSFRNLGRRNKPIYLLVDLTVKNNYGEHVDASGIIR